MLNEIREGAPGLDKTMPLKIRWTVAADMPGIMAIEEDVFESPWTAKTFQKIRGKRNYVMMTAEIDSRVVGYMVYEIKDGALDLLNIAVDRNHWRQGIGRAMIRRLKDKLKRVPRAEVTLTVRETNTRAQYFFRAMGYRATKVLRGHYQDSDDDAYAFEFVQ